MIVQCPECAKRYRLEDGGEQAAEVRIKCADCDAVFRVSLAASGGEARPGEGERRILVCDDAPFFRAMLEEVLTEGGFTVVTASNGEEAVARISAEPPDLLVLDLQMPGMDGFEVIRTIRGGEVRADLPILAMSAVFTDSSDMIDLQDAGADDYISKKFKPEHLLRRVRRLLGLPEEP